MADRAAREPPWLPLRTDDQRIRQTFVKLWDVLYTFSVEKYDKATADAEEWSCSNYELVSVTRAPTLPKARWASPGALLTEWNHTPVPSGAIRLDYPVQPPAHPDVSDTSFWTWVWQSAGKPNP
jgi:hypothetical protein